MFNSIESKFATLLCFAETANPSKLINKKDEMPKQLSIQIGEWNSILESQLQKKPLSNKFIKLYGIVRKLLLNNQTTHVRNALRRYEWNNKKLEANLERFDELSKEIHSRLSMDLNSKKGSPFTFRRDPKKAANANSMDQKFMPLLEFHEEADPLTLLKNWGVQQLVAKVGDWNRILEARLQKKQSLSVSDKFRTLHEVVSTLTSSGTTAVVRSSLREREWDDKTLLESLDRFDELAKRVRDRFALSIVSASTEIQQLDQELENEFSLFLADSLAAGFKPEFFEKENVQFLPQYCFSAEINKLTEFVLSLSSEQLKSITKILSTLSIKIDKNLFYKFQIRLQCHVSERTDKVELLRNDILKNGFHPQKIQEINHLLMEVTTSLKTIKRLVKMFEEFTSYQRMWGKIGSLIQELKVLEFRLTKPNSSASISHLLKEKSIYGAICEKVYTLYHADSEIEESSQAIKVILQWGGQLSDFMQFSPTLGKKNQSPAEDMQEKLEQLDLAKVEDLNKHHIYTIADLRNFLSLK